MEYFLKIAYFDDECPEAATNSIYRPSLEV